MEPGSAGGDHGEQVAAELARLRDALDDLRRRPIPLDIDTLRHVVTASLSEASAPPPNLLVTAIRRLDRLDARLESIEAALGAPAALPRGATPARGRGPAPAAPVALASEAGADPEAIADALARRLAGMIPPRAAAQAAPAATVDDLIRALRPLVPDAARSVLRRAGREPSPQAVELLQQTALSAIEEAARSADQPMGFASDPQAPDPRPLGPAPQVQALAPGTAPPPPPTPAPIDVDQLAASIAAHVAAAVAAQLPPPPPVGEPEPREPAPAPPPPLDPNVVADAVISRLAEQPPPQAVLSATAMVPLLGAVGNVEAAVARMTEPDAQVVGAVDRLEAGVEALARALEDDRALQADEVRRGFADLHELLRSGPLKLLHDVPDWATADIDSAGLDEAGDGRLEGVGDEERVDVTPAAGAQALDRLAFAVAGVERRLDRLSSQLEPLGDADLATNLPELAHQGQRLERTLNHILTALAALAEHLHEQSSTWRGRFDELEAALVTEGVRAETGGGPGARPPGDLGDLGVRIDELVSGLTADRQRFQRLGGTIDGLAELLGQVSSRLDRLPRSVEMIPDRGADEDSAALAVVAATSPSPGATSEVPPVTWFDEEPPARGSRSAAVGVASRWDAPDDEPWMRDDPWSTAADGDVRTPATPEHEADGDDDGDGLGEAGGGTVGAAEPGHPDVAAASPGPPEADGEQLADLTDDRPDVVTASNSREAPADAEPLGPGPVDGGRQPDERRRRRRSRKGNRRG